MLLQLDHVTKYHASKCILNDASWEVKPGEHIALVGENGMGKSTLFRLLSGELSPTQGTITRKRGLACAMIDQEIDPETEMTVYECLLTASERLNALQEHMHALERRMSEPEVYNDPAALERIVNEHARVVEEYAAAGGDRHEGRVRELLTGLGFGLERYDDPLILLSGGEQKMLLIARVFASGAELLLLDEPDNHLDVSAKRWLELQIKTYPGAVLLISHDRYLINQVAQKVVELEDGHLTVFHGDYDAYLDQKQTLLQRQLEYYKVQQVRIKQLERTAKRLLEWAAQSGNPKLAAQGHAKERQLERIERIDRPQLQRKRVAFDFGSEASGSKQVLVLKDLEYNIGSRTLFENVNLTVMRGETVALLGANGSGKSTLLRLILGDLEPSGGIVKIGPSVTIGYYAQQHETLDPEHTLIEEIRLAKPMYEDQAQAYLTQFLFSWEDGTRTIGTLSGGEKARMQIAKLMLSGVNFLLLDEPTNNLDTFSCEVLETALLRFGGTLLVITHDRYFLEKMVDRSVVLEPDGLHEYLGDRQLEALERAARLTALIE